jgi:hypothetical protein
MLDFLISFGIITVFFGSDASNEYILTSGDGFTIFLSLFMLELLPLLKFIRDSNWEDANFGVIFRS